MNEGTSNRTTDLAGTAAERCIAIGDILKCPSTFLSAEIGVTSALAWPRHDWTTPLSVWSEREITGLIVKFLDPVVKAMLVRVDMLGYIKAESPYGNYTVDFEVGVTRPDQPYILNMEFKNIRSSGWNGWSRVGTGLQGLGAGGAKGLVKQVRTRNGLRMTRLFTSNAVA
jgi:hypothetical protein